VSFPAWSAARPELLYFVSDASGSLQAWCHDLTDGRTTRLTDQAVGVESVTVLPDGSGIAWWSDDTGTENGQWVVTDADGSGPPRPLVPQLAHGWAQGLSVVAGTIAVGLADDTTYRVYVLAAGDQPRLVHESASPAGLGREWEGEPYGGLSSDGTLLCYRHSERGDILHFGLRIVDARTGVHLADLVDDGRTLKAAAWSPVPGDQRLAFVHERDGVERAGVWSADTGRRDFPLDLPGPVDVAGWWPDGRALLLLHERFGRRTLHRLETDDGSLSGVHDPHGWVSAAAVRPDGEVWLREEAAERAPRVRTLDGRVVLAPAGDPPAPGRPHRNVVFAGPAGPTHMLLTVPDGPAPFPTVLLVHGGPEWAFPDDLDPWEQALVEHGYAVAKVNYRGSTGSTVAWRTALHGGNIGFPELADVVAGLDHLVETGVTDPGRVAIEGWSWGGYVAVLAAGLEPGRFAAVIGGIPVCDSVLCHEDCSPPQQAYDVAIMGGTPSELSALYAERSPITYVDRVRAPVLLIAGEYDSACPIRQVRHYADTLRELGGRVTLHVYPAGHHANTVAERLRHADLELAFLAEHLGGPVSAGA
jgi:dipeptidyl aminopeptidase/acylaminoacyl peptidase